MQAVILAAGQSTRTFPLTVTRPKPLLRIGNKTILEHNLDSLNGLVDEIIIVVGYHKEKIMDFLGKEYKKMRIRYVLQKEQKGTGHAVLLTQKYVKGPFFLLMGDDLYSRKDMVSCKKYPNAILAKKVSNPSNFGVIVHKNNRMIDLVEKPETFVSNLASTAFHKLNPSIFSFLKKIKPTARGEIEMPDALKLLSNHEDIRVVQTTNWQPIGYPWDVLEVDMKLRKGKNVVGRNSRIEGKISNSNIGNNCTIFGTVKNSIIMDNTIIEKNALVENSIIGSGCIFSGMVKSADCISIVRGKEVKVKNFGSAIGDNVIAKNVRVKPGIKIWPNRKIQGTIASDIM